MDNPLQTRKEKKSICRKNDRKEKIKMNSFNPIKFMQTKDKRQQKTTKDKKDKNSKSYL
jgi:hypothetical protein